MKSIISAVALFALSLVCVASTSARILAPSKPSQLGTIFSANGTPNACGTGSGELAVQLLPDATAVPFAVPAGAVFVLTRLDVSLAGGGVANVNLRGVNTATGAASNFAFQTLQVSGLPTTIHFDFPNGLIVKPGVRLCISSGSMMISVGDSYGYGYFAKK